MRSIRLGKRQSVNSKHASLAEYSGEMRDYVSSNASLISSYRARTSEQREELKAKQIFRMKIAKSWVERRDQMKRI